jgi:hypothetical protein
MSSVRYKPKRIRAEPGVNTPSTGDYLALDNATTGFTKLSIDPTTGWFAATFCPLGSARQIAAGNNIVITDNGVSWIISRSTGQATDDFEVESVGPISVLAHGVGFYPSGIITVQDETSGDDMESYATGAITTLTGGNGWAGPGTLEVAPDPQAGDDMESYATGAITTLTGGTGWAGYGGVFTPA